MAPYIFDKRGGIHIIDLTKSIVLLERAVEFVYQTVASGKSVLFVGTKKQAQDVMREAAESAGQPFMTNRWLGGTLTNNTTIRKSIRRMREIEEMGKKTDGALSVHKKEAASLRRELDKLERNLGGIADMERLPGALFIVDVNREKIAVDEATRLGIPVVAIVDTNCDPDEIDYVVPGNDDAIRAVKLIADAVAKVCKGAADEAAKHAASEARRAEAEKAAAKAASEARRAVAVKKAEENKVKAAEARKSAAEEAKKAVAARAAEAAAAAAAAPVAEETETKAPAAEAPVVEAAPAESVPVAKKAKKAAPKAKKAPAAEKAPVEAAPVAEKAKKAAPKAKQAPAAEKAPAEAAPVAEKAKKAEPKAKKAPAAETTEPEAAPEAAAATEEAPAEDKA